MKQAIVAIEDRRFFEHRGVDLRGIVRAVWADIQHQARRPGRLDDHAAVREERATSADERLDRRKLKEAALAWQLEQQLVEGPDPDRVPEHDLLRERRVRDPAGRAGLLRPQRQDADAARGGAPRRDPAGPVAVRPGGEPDRPRASGAATCCGRCSTSGRSRAREFRTASRAPLPTPSDVQLPGTQGPAPYFVNYVKQQLVDRCGCAARSSAAACSVTTTIDLGLQDAAQQAISKWLTRPGRAVRGPRRDRPAERRGAGDGRRQQLPQEPVQPGRAGTSASRARRSSRSCSRRRSSDGISPVTEFDSKPVEILTGDRVWVVHNYENAYVGRPTSRPRRSTPTTRSMRS